HQHLTSNAGYPIQAIIPGLGYTLVRRTFSGHHMRTLQGPSPLSSIDPSSDQIMTH
uniref:Uncharacterized protein n=1 Tax=Triticum urartu TaxID=4572 RepID=A0A8R7PUV9_TRIUA